MSDGIDTPLEEINIEIGRVIISQFWMDQGNIFVNDRTELGWFNFKPEIFALTIEQVLAVYHKYGESLFREDKAVAEILGIIIKHGWMRIRHYESSWEFAFASSGEWLNYVVVFAKFAVDSKVMRSDESIVLEGLEDGYKREYSTQKGGAKALLIEYQEWEGTK